MNTYACSNIQDNIDSWNKIKDYLQPDDKLFILGDVFSSKAEGYQILKEVLADARCVLLLGDHEQMMIDGIKDYKADGNFLTQYYFWVFKNRGSIIFSQWQTDQERTLILSELMESNYSHVYKNSQGQTIFLSHAGSSSITLDRHELIANSIHFLYPAQEDIIVVHGHIAAQTIAKKLQIPYTEGEPLWYQTNKVDIYTSNNTISLLNLEDFTYINL